MKKVILCISLAFSYLIALNAQDQVTLVVSGISNTKEDATASALRSAIEQTYGTFVSSNTAILDDELVKDEVVTISQGNIQSYRELSCITHENGRIEVQLQATVSISKLVSYAKSKGASAELSGGTFGVNMKLFEVNKKNEQAALQNLYTLLKGTPPLSLFEYKMDVEGPFADEGRYSGTGGYTVNIKVNLYPNDNTQQFFDIFYRTINAIGIKPGGEFIWQNSAEQESLEKMGIQLYNLGDGTYNQKTLLLLRNSPAERGLPPFIDTTISSWETNNTKAYPGAYTFDINLLIEDILKHITIADNLSFPKESPLINERHCDNGYVFNYADASEKGCKKFNRRKGYNYDSNYNKGAYLEFRLIIPKDDISKYNNFTIVEK